MEELDLGFCAICCDEIKSRSLLMFWKCMCVASATTRAWSEFDEDDTQAMRLIKALEAKNFIVSSDHGSKIVTKPHGVYEREDGSYLACVCFKEHFEEIHD